MDIYTGRKVRTVTSLAEYQLVGEDTPWDTDVQDALDIPANFASTIYFSLPDRLVGALPLVFLGLKADSGAVLISAPPQVITHQGTPIEVHMRNPSGSAASTGNLLFVFGEIDRAISY